MCIHTSVYNTYTCGPLDACNHVGFSLLSILKWINKNIVLKKFANIRCFYLMNICHCHTNTTAQHFGVQKLWCRWGTRYLWLNYLDLTACSFLNKVPVWKREDFASVTISWQRTFCLQLLWPRMEKKEKKKGLLWLSQSWWPSQSLRIIQTLNHFSRRTSVHPYLSVTQWVGTHKQVGYEIIILISYLGVRRPQSMSCSQTIVR